MPISKRARNSRNFESHLGPDVEGAQSVESLSVTSKQIAKRQLLAQRNVHNIVDNECSTSTGIRSDESLPGPVCDYDLHLAMLPNGFPSSYRDLGDPVNVCVHCSAVFWESEALKSYFRDQRLHYHKCCEDGRVMLPSYNDPPDLLKSLLQQKSFLDNIRAYNQMFSMTSFGARIDDGVNRGKGPYVFKVSGQIYHWIGSLCPLEGQMPRFLQLYIYDTEHEIVNRMSPFGGSESGLSSAVVSSLINVLDNHNELVKLFRTARDRCRETSIPDFSIRLFNVAGSRQHDLPSNSNTLGAIVFDSGPRSIGDYDVIVQLRGGNPERVNKLHCLYMSLQFPLAFVYGEPGYHMGLKLCPPGGSIGRRSQKMTMNMFYNYRLHERSGMYSLLMRTGRLFQQFVVTAYCSIELDRIDYIRSKQQDIRNDYLAGLYDAINRGDQRGSDVGSRTILPASFTGGPRYMYSHYLDALAICRSYGNPLFFITFTCNSNWPEIRRFMASYPLLTTADRADIVVRVFNFKIKDFLTFLKTSTPLGSVRGVLGTIEFHKRGLPHCHTLLWVRSEIRSLSPSEIDRFISAELPDPAIDPCDYKVISYLMMHGPCGLANLSAPCMQGEERRCSKKFPKAYNEETFIDKEGFVHYRRRNSKILAAKKGVELDNSYVVPYNRALCLAFTAHINVEYCGWSMLIKYLFKYISKGTDRLAVQISKTGSTDPNAAGSSQAGTRVPVDEIKNFVDARFICPYEACWRIFNFPIHFREPVVQILAVHLANMQIVNFYSSQLLTSVVNDPVYLGC